MRAGTFIAALVAVFAFLVGSIAVAGVRHGDLSVVSDFLFRRAGDPSLVKTTLAWAWLVLGVAAVGGAFLAFVALDGDDLPNRLPHRRFPKLAPVILLASSLGVLWLLLAPPRLNPQSSADAARIAPEPPALDVEARLAGAPTEKTSQPSSQELVIEPVVAPIAEEPKSPQPSEPIAPAEIEKAATTSEETSLYWTFEHPIVSEGRVLSSPEADRDIARLIPMKDADGAVARMLCGKIWVAFSGSASEEGPRERNALRSHARANLLAARGKAWLDAHSDCDRPVILALDLGQHEPTGAGDPARTAYQRQAIIISRARTSPAEKLSAEEARGELEAFYADAEMRGRLLGGRRFGSEPVIFAP